MARQVAVHFDRHHPLLLSRQAPRIGTRRLPLQAPAPPSPGPSDEPRRALSPPPASRSHSAHCFSPESSAPRKPQPRSAESIATSPPQFLQHSWGDEPEIPSSSHPEIHPGHPPTCPATRWPSSLPQNPKDTLHDASFVSHNHCAGRLRLLSQSPHLEHRNLQIGHGVFTQVAQLRIARHHLHGGNSLASGLPSVKKLPCYNNRDAVLDSSPAIHFIASFRSKTHICSPSQQFPDKNAQTIRCTLLVISMVSSHFSLQPLKEPRSYHIMSYSQIQPWIRRGLRSKRLVPHLVGGAIAAGASADAMALPERTSLLLRGWHVVIHNQK